MKHFFTLLICFIAYQTVAQVAVKTDSVRLGNPTGSGSIGLFGKIFLKQITQGTSIDSILVRDASGQLKFVKGSSFEPNFATGSGLQLSSGVLKVSGLIKTDVGLGNTDNTSDMNKPVSTATQTAFNLKADLSSPALTGTPTVPTASTGTNTTQIASTAFVKSSISASDFITPDGTQTLTNKTLITPVISSPTGLIKADVGLANVDNTSDMNKPVSTATQTAFNLKADLSSPALTGTPTVPTASTGTNTTQIASTAFVKSSISASDFITPDGTQTLTNKTLITPVISSPTGLIKADVGLANVDNISDTNKPVSTATQTALNLKANLSSPVLTGTPTVPTATTGTNTTQIASTAFVNAAVGATGGSVTQTGAQTLTNKTLTAPVIISPTGLLKTDVGLGNVDNTSDTNKPISTATQIALNLKANLSSPVLTGTPTVPTAATGTNTTQIASTAFVNASISASGGSVTLTGTQTLTNKTLTAPTISSPKGLVKTDVGLGNIDNTSDTNKPVSSATQIALNLKANLASPALTGIPTVPTASTGTNTTQAASTAFVNAAVSSSGGVTLTGTQTLTNKTLTAPTISSPKGLVKADVGLGNIDNTSDTNKPVSSATQIALNLKANLASPALTGIPTVPTASTGTNTIQAASTAFVNAAVSSSGGVTLTGTQTLTNKTLTAPVINNGVINGTSIGQTTAAAGTFSTLNATSTAVITGSLKTSQLTLSALNTAPASSTATGTTGEIRVTSTYIYVCISTNKWVRVALTTW